MTADSNRIVLIVAIVALLSSAGFVDRIMADEVRRQACVKELVDHKYIAEHFNRAVPTQLLMQRAMQSSEKLGEERLVLVMRLIKEADAAAAAAMRGWMEGYVNACMNKTAHDYEKPILHKS